MKLQLNKIKHWLIEKWLTVFVSAIFLWMMHFACASFNDGVNRIETKIDRINYAIAWVDTDKAEHGKLQSNVLQLNDSVLFLRSDMELCFTQIATIKNGLLPYNINIR